MEIELSIDDGITWTKIAVSKGAPVIVYLRKFNGAYDDGYGSKYRWLTDEHS